MIARNTDSKDFENQEKKCMLISRKNEAGERQKSRKKGQIKIVITNAALALGSWKKDVERKPVDVN